MSLLVVGFGSVNSPVVSVGEFVTFEVVAELMALEEEDVGGGVGDDSVDVVGVTIVLMSLCVWLALGDDGESFTISLDVPDGPVDD